MPDTLTLRQAAEELGVHYMTAYRYVRTGRLKASRVGNEYRVRAADLALLLDPDYQPLSYRDLLEARLVAADEPGAWQVVEMALNSGTAPSDVYLKMLSPAITSIGSTFGARAETVHKVHQATAIATRVMARLGPRFRHRGSPRARVIIGGVANDTHALASAMMADLLRDEKYDVIDLGADTPALSFARALEENPETDIVALTSISSGNQQSICEVIKALRAVRHVPILIGGSGVGSVEEALALGANGWTNSRGRALELFASHVRRQEPTAGEAQLLARSLGKDDLNRDETARR